MVGCAIAGGACGGAWCVRDVGYEKFGADAEVALIGSSVRMP